MFIGKVCRGFELLWPLGPRKLYGSRLRVATGFGFGLGFRKVTDPDVSASSCLCCCHCMLLLLQLLSSQVVLALAINVNKGASTMQKLGLSLADPLASNLLRNCMFKILVVMCMDHYYCSRSST